MRQICGSNLNRAISQMVDWSKGQIVKTVESVFSRLQVIGHGSWVIGYRLLPHYLLPENAFSPYLSCHKLLFVRLNDVRLNKEWDFSFDQSLSRDSKLTVQFLLEEWPTGSGTGALVTLIFLEIWKVCEMFKPEHILSYQPHLSTINSTLFIFFIYCVEILFITSYFLSK